MLIRVVAPHFVAGVIIKDDLIVHTAPILGYTRGWSQFRFINHCRSKGWKLGVVK